MAMFGSGGTPLRDFSKRTISKIFMLYYKIRISNLFIEESYIFGVVIQEISSNAMKMYFILNCDL